MPHCFLSRFFFIVKSPFNLKVLNGEKLCRQYLFHIPLNTPHHHNALLHSRTAKQISINRTRHQNKRAYCTMPPTNFDQPDNRKWETYCHPLHHHWVPSHRRTTSKASHFRPPNTLHPRTHKYSSNRLAILHTRERHTHKHTYVHAYLHTYIQSSRKH